MNPRALLVGSFLVVLGCANAPPPPSSPALQIGAPSAPIAGATPPESTPPTSDAPSEDDVVVPVTAADPVWGDRNAPVTIVWFGDFQCPFTGKSAPIIRALEEKYGPKALRVVWKNEPLPFHNHARAAAEAGAIVRLLGGNDAFWKFHRLAFDDQKNVGTLLAAWAESSGIERRAFEQMIAAHAGAGKVDADHALAAAVYAAGTPHFFVNGVRIAGAQSIDKFVAVIDAERTKALAQIEAGAPADRVYALMTAQNFKAQAHPELPDHADEKDDLTIYKIPVGASPTRGKPGALVTIVELADFQCPYSKRAEATLEALRTKYGDKLRVVWKDEPLPFHPRAEPAAELAREARAQKGDGAFWSVHDALFASQPMLDDADLEAIAQRFGVDVTRARAAIQWHRYKAQIEADASIADDFQATGTPAFFINGRKLIGAHPQEKFEKIIDAEIARAQAQLGKGTAPGALYDALIKDGVGAPPMEVNAFAAPPGAPSRGSGPVVIQEIGDFQSPLLARAEEPLAEVEKAYPGKVKIVWRNLPLPTHVDAELAAEAALEAKHQKGDAGFWRMHDKLLGGQKQQRGLERAALDDYARDLGLDLAKFDDALDRHVHQATIAADTKALSDAGIFGVPALSIGGYFLNGVPSAAKLRRAIDLVLASGPAKAPPAPPVVKVAPATTLGIADLKAGSGPIAQAGDTLVVHYVGRLADGTEFDSSRAHGRTFSFKLGSGMVIKGWDQGLVGMHVGGTRRLTIPPDLGYGDRGSPPKIGPNATLVFDVELIAVQ